MGSTTGAFAIRNGRFKYVHYVKYAPQLFDLESDPDEACDLAGDPRYAALRDACEAKLRKLLSPEGVDARAKKRQAEQLERYGGRKAVIARGDLGFSRRPASGPNSSELRSRFVIRARMCEMVNRIDFTLSVQASLSPHSDRSLTRSLGRLPQA